MLTFEEKINVIETHFPQLVRNEVSLGRINYHLPESRRNKKIVVQHLHPNGNGFVFAGHLPKKERNEKGMVNIREDSENELITVIGQAIDYLLSGPSPDEQETISAEPRKEYWIGGIDHERLLLVNEDELWNVYAGLNLEAAFESYKEAHDYLLEEGFEQE